MPSSKDWPARFLVAKAQALAMEIPEVVDNSHLVAGILDQGQLGSCAACAVAQALRGALMRLGKSPTLAACLYLYYMARCIDGEPSMDSGTTLRAVLDGARRVGYPPERFWPYSDGPDRFRMRPDNAAVRASYDQIARLSCHKLGSTGKQRSQDLRALLAAGYLVIFGTQVSEAFASFGPNSPPLNPPGPGEIILGGHALTLANCTPGRFQGPNSWGVGYGRAGWFEMTDAYIEDPRSNSFWVIDQVAPFSEV